MKSNSLSAAAILASNMASGKPCKARPTACKSPAPCLTPSRHERPTPPRTPVKMEIKGETAKLDPAKEGLATLAA
eukprot:1278477-Alexandrium_andersonii.AAC.1